MLGLDHQLRVPIPFPSGSSPTCRECIGTSRARVGIKSQFSDGLAPPGLAGCTPLTPRRIDIKFIEPSHSYNIAAPAPWNATSTMTNKTTLWEPGCRNQERDSSTHFEVRRRRRLEPVFEGDNAVTQGPGTKEGSCGSPGAKRRPNREARRPHWLIRGSESSQIRTGRQRHGYVGDVNDAAFGGKVVSGKSLLELDFLIVTDAFENNFVDIIAQPFSTDIVVRARKRIWTPDFLIKHQNWLRRAG